MSYLPDQIQKQQYNIHKNAYEILKNSLGSYMSSSSCMSGGCYK